MLTCVPIRDLRDTNKISQLCKESNDPIIVTKNGYEDMVVMSMDVFNRMWQVELRAKIDEGIRQADNGETEDAFEFFAKARKKYIK